MNIRYKKKRSIGIQIIHVLIFLSGVFILLGCTADPEVEVDEQKLDQLEKQLEVVYEQCANEKIDDLDALEEILNNGGNGISKPCRIALGDLDFEGIIVSFDLNLGFQTPKPAEELNPIRDRDYPWVTITNWNAANKQLTITSGVETVDWEDVQIKGGDSNGGNTPITDFTFADISLNDSIISYTTDYSGSMLDGDLEKISEYYAQFHQVLPNGIPTIVQVFSDEVTPKLEGVTTNSDTVAAAFSFDSSYPRGATALFDAWGLALGDLKFQNKNLSLNILATDGFENSSKEFDEETLKSAIAESDAFNLIVGSGWSEPKRLKELVGDKGLVVFTYQIDEAQEITSDIKAALDNIKTVTINENVSVFSELHFLVNDITKLVVVLSP